MPRKSRAKKPKSDSSKKIDDVKVPEPKTVYLPPPEILLTPTALFAEEEIIPAVPTTKPLAVNSARRNISAIHTDVPAVPTNKRHMHKARADRGINNV